jgi:hypothetical protein
MSPASQVLLTGARLEIKFISGKKYRVLAKFSKIDEFPATNISRRKTVSENQKRELLTKAGIK